MRVTLYVPMQLIDFDKKPAINPKSLRFAILLLKGEKLPPISLQRLDNGRYRLTGGRHRFTAHRLVGRKQIQATLGIPQDPNPYKALRHAPDKPRTFDDVGLVEPQTWLEL